MQPTKIKLMADYDCSPLWWMSDDKVGQIELDELPLNKETVGRLEKWVEFYGAKLNREDPANSPGFTPEEESAFEREGFSLLEQLQKELAHSEIVYFSETLRRVVTIAEINSIKASIGMLL
jgi:hypothetical protein